MTTKHQDVKNPTVGTILKIYEGDKIRFWTFFIKKTCSTIKLAG